MQLSFDRHGFGGRSSWRASRASSPSQADATGTPFTQRTAPDGARPMTERRDFREQADGAP